VSEPFLLRAEGVTKRFGATQALDAVDLVLKPGEVHALLGPNGAGKSTFIKILDGVYTADSGTFDTAGNAIAIIHQDLGLLPDLTVRENIALGHNGGFRRAGVLIDIRRERALTVEALQQVGLEVAPETPVRDLGLGERTLVAVARAITQDAQVLVLDEVTAGLTAAESEWLFVQVRNFVARGGGVVVVSHRLQEIVENCDTVTLFRDGRIGFQGPTPDLVELHALFAAAAHRENDHESTAAVAAGPVLVDLDGAETAAIGPISLQVRGGEVLGVVGQLTSGLYELGHLIAGTTPLKRGRMTTTARAGRGSARIGFVPEDRWAQGLLGDMDMRANVTLANVAGFRTPLGFLRLRRERDRAIAMVAELDVRPPRPELPVRALSGGNAQKVLMGRAATADPDVFVLCEPTRGVDVTTRHAIYDFVRRARADGAAVVIITMDVDDALAVADRISVMRDGGLAAAADRAEVDAETLLAQTA
jgi:ribose transport system ATP-binding protein